MESAPAPTLHIEYDSRTCRLWIKILYSLCCIRLSITIMLFVSIAVFEDSLTTKCLSWLLCALLDNNTVSRSNKLLDVKPATLEVANISQGAGLREVDNIFAARCYASAAYVVMRCPTVRLSVRHVRGSCQNE